MKYTAIDLQTLQDNDLILTIENKIRGGISSLMGDRYAKSDENKKIIYIDASNLHGHSKTQPLPYDEIKFDENIKLKDRLNTPDNSDIGYPNEVDMTYLDNIEEKTKHFPFAPENIKIITRKFTTFMKKKQIKYLYTC